MSDKWTAQLENLIIGKLVTALIDAGFRIQFSDQDGGGLFCYAWQGGSKMPMPSSAWVRLVPGNGADMIADYTTNLEESIKSVNEFCAHFQ